MNGWKVAAVIPLVFGIALAACSESGNGATFGEGGACPGKAPPSVQDDAEMTVEELTDLVAEAITCPGYVFRFRSEGEYGTESYGYHLASDTWLDIENNVARTESMLRLAPSDALREAEEAGLEDAEQRYTVILRADARYALTENIGYPEEENQNPLDKNRPPQCHGPGLEALGSLILCEGPLSDWETSVERDVSYRGQEAVALLTEGESSDADGTWEITFRLYFDAETLLPLGRMDESSSSAPVDTDATYENEFVRLDSLPEDFFDPASLGYVEVDEEAQLEDAEIEVYWLGSTFEGNENYPALGIRHAIARPRAQTSERGFIAQIAYRDADDEFGHIWVRIELYTPEAWGFREQDTLENPCDKIVELDLPGSDATIRNRGGQSSDGTCNPQNGFIAVVRFDDVVVDIDAPTTNSGGQAFRSPYDSEEGMELLVRGLELRESTAD